LNEDDIQSNRKLCSFHFLETDFGKGVKRRSLKSNAIPTIFEEGLSHETTSTFFEGHAFLCCVTHVSFVEFNIINILIIIGTVCFIHDHLLITEDKEIPSI